MRESLSLSLSILTNQKCRAFVVDVDSASPQLPGVTYYGIEADHSNMCKFDGPSAPGFRTMVTSIKEWVKEAPPVIEVRWTVEQEDRVARARREIEERRLTVCPSLTHTPHILTTFVTLL